MNWISNYLGKNLKKISLAFFALAALAVPAFVSAHEAYVLTSAQFHSGLAMKANLKIFGALNNPGNLQTFFEISISIIIVLILAAFFMRTRLADWGKRMIEKLAPFGPLVVRLSLAASFFLSAVSWSFLGPELPLTMLPYAVTLRFILFAVSIFIGLGLFTEWAALVALVVYSIAWSIFGMYLLSYINYFGEIIVLVLVGSRYLSLDHLFFGRKRWFRWFEKYEVLFVRVCYGFALGYAAVNIKILHSILTTTVVIEYNLTRFHWLFPHDPMLVTLGAAFAEIAIALFIMFGFELRLTVLVSLFYITMSLLFFREAVWPHIILYGISIELLVSPEVWAIDNWIRKKPRLSP